MQVNDINNNNQNNNIRWFVRGQDKKKNGPYIYQQMLEGYYNGQINKSTYVACTGMKQWVHLGDLPILSECEKYKQKRQFIESYEHKSSFKSFTEEFGRAFKFGLIASIIIAISIITIVPSVNRNNTENIIRENNVQASNQQYTGNTTNVNEVTTEKEENTDVLADNRPNTENEITDINESQLSNDEYSNENQPIQTMDELLNDNSTITEPRIESIYTEDGITYASANDIVYLYNHTDKGSEYDYNLNGNVCITGKIKNYGQEQGLLIEPVYDYYKTYYIYTAEDNLYIDNDALSSILGIRVYIKTGLDEESFKQAAWDIANYGTQSNYYVSSRFNAWVNSQQDNGNWYDEAYIRVYGVGSIGAFTYSIENCTKVELLDAEMNVVATWISDKE